MITKIMKITCAITFVLYAIHASAGIAVVTGKGSAVDSVTIADAKNVFLKKKDSLNGVRLIPLDLPKEDASRETFYEVVVNKTPDQLLSYWSRLIFTGKGVPPEEASSVEELSYLLSQNLNLIGYVAADKVTSDMKVVLEIK